MADALTEEDVNARIAKAVADAVEPLTSQLAERDTKITDLELKLEERDTSDAVTKAVADAVEPLNARIATLETELTDATTAKDAAESEAKALTDWFTDLASTESAKTRRTDRVAAVKETGIWPESAFDESVEENKDRIESWASMDDAVFDALIEGWKIAGPRKDAGNGKLPEKHGLMVDALTEGDDTPKGGGKSGLGSFFKSTIDGLATAGADS